MALATALGLPFSRGLPWSPAALFAAGAQGAWYDNSDLSAMFADANGLTPATVNNGVALQLDKRLGLIREDEFVPHTDFSGGSVVSFGKTVPTGWVAYTPANVSASSVATESFQFTATAHLAGVTLSGSGFPVAPRWVEYTIRARRLSTTSGTPSLQLYSGVWNPVIPSSIADGVWIEESVIVYASSDPVISNFTGAASWEVSNFSVRELPGNHRFQLTPANEPILRGTPIVPNLQTVGGWSAGAGWAIAGNTATATATVGALLANDVTPTIGKIYRVRYTVTRSAGSVTVSLGSALGTARSASGTYTDYITAASASKPAFNGGGGGFTGTVVLDSVEIADVSADAVRAPYFLRYNGTSSFLVTNAIDFTGTDKMTVVVGLRKASDAAIGNIVEASANSAANNGTFALSAPQAAAAATYGAFVRGTAGASPIAGAAAPDTSVITLAGDISGDSSAIRRNGVLAQALADDLGAGNFGNHALYFGARAGTSLFFHGDEYQSTVLGAALGAGSLGQLERFAASRTGVAL